MKTALEKNDQQGVSSVFLFGVILGLVYLRSKRQVPSTEAANSAIYWLTPTVLCSTTELRPRCISTETEGRRARSPPRRRGGSHNIEVERQTISLFYCRNCPTGGGKLLAARKKAPIQVPKSWR